MSDNLNRLCQIDITLDNPVQTSAGYDCLLLIGDAPKTPKNDVPKVGVYTNLDEVKDGGSERMQFSLHGRWVQRRCLRQPSPRP